MAATPAAAAPPITARGAPSPSLGVSPWETGDSGGEVGCPGGLGGGKVYSVSPAVGRITKLILSLQTGGLVSSRAQSIRTDKRKVSTPGVSDWRSTVAAVGSVSSGAKGVSTNVTRAVSPGAGTEPAWVMVTKRLPSVKHGLGGFCEARAWQPLTRCSRASMTKSRSLLSYSLGVGQFTTARLRLPPDTCESQSADVSSTLQKRLKVHLTDFRYAFPGVAGGGGDGGDDGGGGEGGGEGGERLREREGERTEREISRATGARSVRAREGSAVAAAWREWAECGEKCELQSQNRLNTPRRDWKRASAGIPTRAPGWRSTFYLLRLDLQIGQILR